MPTKLRTGPAPLALMAAGLLGCGGGGAELPRAKVDTFSVLAAPAPARSAPPGTSAQSSISLDAISRGERPAALGCVSHAPALHERARSDALEVATPRAVLEGFVSTLKKRKYATKQEAVVKEKSSNANDARQQPSKVMPAHPRQRGRYVPAAVRRAVFERDGGRCTYRDPSGRLCGEAHRLEFHHLKPFAAGGEHEVSNLTLRCASHNALAADEDFGRERMQEKRSPGAHESFRKAERSFGG